MHFLIHCYDKRYGEQAVKLAVRSTLHYVHITEDKFYAGSQGHMRPRAQPVQSPAAAPVNGAIDRNPDQLY